MKDARNHIMLTFTIVILLVISCIANPKHRLTHREKDSRLLAEEILNRVANYGGVFDDDFDDEERDKRSSKNIDEYRQHPRSLQVRPYEDYNDYRDGDDSDDDDALYKQAIKEIYDDIDRRKRSRYESRKNRANDDVKERKEEHDNIENNKLHDNTKSSSKRLIQEKVRVVNDKKISIDSDTNLQVKSGTKSSASTKADNNQVADVAVDDSVQQQQDFANKLDPAEVFLEPNANNTNTSGEPSHAHVKSNKATTTSTKKHDHHGLDETSFIAIIAGCCIAGIAGMVLASFCWYKLRQESNPKDVPGSPVISKKTDSPTGMKPEDEKLVQSAEVFHYLHAKKQMQQMQEPPEKAGLAGSGDEDDDEDTVYECPGLAPPGDMKVMNPLFSDAESHHSDKQSDSPDTGDSPLPPQEDVTKPLDRKAK